MDLIIFLVYIALGYWAVGETIDANRIIISTFHANFMRKVTIAFVCGFVLIPVAIIKKLITR